jgi:predicted unusual protein kinase regulating ubiquinone biosynthesis (AarF/ABC1/UbiB family)
MQKLFHEQAGVFVPGVLKAYTHSRYAVTIMDTIDGILKKAIERGNRKLLLYIARQVKKLVATLARNKLQHGDLHVANMAFKLRLVNGRLMPHIALIDFGRSAAHVTNQANVDFDRFWVWRSTRNLPDFNNALRDVGFPGSTNMADATEGDHQPDCETLERCWYRVERVAKRIILAQSHH